MFNFKLRKKLEGYVERYSKGSGNYVFSYEFCNVKKVLCKKDVLNDFAKSTGKYLRQSLFFNKVAVAQVFPCESFETFNNIYFNRKPPVAASVTLASKKNSKK